MIKFAACRAISESQCENDPPANTQNMKNGLSADDAEASWVVDKPTILPPDILLIHGLLIIFADCVLLVLD